MTTSDSAPDDLFVRLINHRVTDQHARREDFLTECFAWVLRSDRDLLGSFLTLVFGPDGPVSGADAVITTQVPMEGDRPDLVIDAEGRRLIVECKVDAAYDSGQIERYLAHAHRHGQAWVCALVPEGSVPAQLPADPRFRRVVTWEEVEAILAASTEAHRYRGWLRRLLHEYGLKRETGVIDLDSEGDRTLASVLDDAARRVQRDDALMGSVPAVFWPPAGPSLLVNTYRSGAGPSPRPILSHQTTLPSRFYAGRFEDFGNLSLTVGFRRPVSLPRHWGPVPMVSVGMWCHPLRGRVFQKDPCQFLATLVEAGGLMQLTDAGRARLEARAPGIWERWQSDIDALLLCTAQGLTGSAVPVQSPPVLHREGWGVSFEVCPTLVLVPPGAEADEIGDRYEGWLRALIAAFVASEPHRPLLRLLDVVLG